MKTKIQGELEGIFKNMYNSELVDGEHPTLAKAPAFSYCPDDNDNEFSLSLECHEGKDDDAWIGWIDEQCALLGLKVTFREWQDWTYHRNYKLS